MGRILIGLGFVPIALTISYQAALAAPVYLNCQASGVLVVSRYLTIDYGTSTVVTSGLNVTTPTPDVEGRTAQSPNHRFRHCVHFVRSPTRTAHRKLHAHSAKRWYDLFRAGHTAWGILDLPSWCEARAQVFAHPPHRQLISAIGISDVGNRPGDLRSCATTDIGCAGFMITSPSSAGVSGVKTPARRRRAADPAFASSCSRNPRICWDRLYGGPPIRNDRYIHVQGHLAFGKLSGETSLVFTRVPIMRMIKDTDPQRLAAKATCRSVLH